jgi:hypothetical protein
MQANGRNGSERAVSAGPVGRLRAAIHSGHRTMFRIVSYRPDVDGRIFLAGALSLYFLVVAIPRIVWGVNVWTALGVPPGPSLFFDTRNLTAALDCRRLGYNPLFQNPCDPWRRPLNYPRAWLAFRWLGLNQSHTDALALTFILLFFVAVFLLIGRVSLGEGILVAVAVCSPSVMFAIERANMDIVVFSLLVLAVIAWRRPGRVASLVSPLTVLLAAILKIYPAFGLPTYLFLRKRAATLTAILCIMAFTIYAALTLSDIRQVAHVAPQGDFHAFGARILPAAIYHRFVPARWQRGVLTKQLLALVPLILVGPVVWFRSRRGLPDPDPESDAPHRLAFYLGSFLFIGTFAIANNYDYRLVVILLTLPQLCAWISDRGNSRRSLLASLTTVVVLILLWIGALSAQLARTDEVATWAAVGLYVGLLAASIPRLSTIWRTISASGAPA